MDSRVEDLVAAFIERVDAGESLTPQRFAAEHPEHEARLLEALGALASTEATFPSLVAETRDRIGPYRVLTELGRGGMGRVLEVEHDDRPGERLALKILSITSAFNPRHLERLEREGDVLSRLNHPNIVRVESVGTLEGQPYIAMRLVDGPTIAERIQAASDERAPLDVPGEGEPAARVARVCAKIARAVAAAHEVGLLHRDLKPANVILPEDGEPVLIDFGLVGGDTGPTLTLSGDVIGTPHYMAPEQARGHSANERTDVYGIGAILYEMLTRSPPHPGTDPLSVVDAVKRRPLRAPRRLAATLPRDLETIVLRAMAYVPRRRYAGALALAADLELFGRGRSIVARRPSLIERAGSAIRFHRGAILVAATVLLVVGLAWALNRTDPEARKQRLRDARERAALAWYRSDASALDEAADQLAALVGDTPVVRFLRHEVSGAAAPTTGLGHRLVQGVAAQKAKRFDDAVNHFTAAVNDAPASPLVRVMLGLAAKEAERHAIAVDAFNVAANSLARPAGLLLELSMGYRKIDRLDDALEAARRATKAMPESVPAWVELGYVQYKRSVAGLPGGTNEGVAATLKAVELSGDKVTQRTLRAHAFALERAGDYAACETIYRRMLAQVDSVQNLYLLAYSLDWQHKGIEARDTYRKVIARAPKHVAAIAQLAFLHAGARTAEGCKGCAAMYRTHPELRDLDEAKRLGAKLIALDRGRSHLLLGNLVTVIRETGYPQALIDALKTCKRNAYREKKHKVAARIDKVLWEIESSR